MRRSHRILLAVADPAAQASLRLALEGRGHAVALLDDAQRLLRADWPQPPDLLLLCSPWAQAATAGMSGEDPLLVLLRGLRLRSTLPVIVLTDRDDPADRVLALHSGADDCLSRPWVLGELMARVEAVLRRWRASPGPVSGAVNGTAADSSGHAHAHAPVPVAVAAPSAGAALQAGPWRLDPMERTLEREGGPCLPLTAAEFRLMRAFFERPRHVLERADLLALAADEAGAASRGVDLLVSRLRGKLGDDARAPRCIRTVRGRGYRFEAP